MQYQPSPSAATDIASVHPATLTEVVYHRELRDFESLTSFPRRGSPKDLRFSDGVIPLQVAFHFGTFGTLHLVRFLRWNRRFRSPKSEIEHHRLLNTGPRFAKDFDIPPDILSVTYRHDSGENSARWYPYT